MIVSQQEIDVFRTVLANRSEYNEALDALDIIAAKKGNLEAAYPALALETDSTRGEFPDKLKKLAQDCWEKCLDQLKKIDRTRLTEASVDALFHVVLAYAAHAGITQGVVVAIVFILLKQKF